jgi:hypothetical protein
MIPEPKAPSPKGEWQCLASWKNGARWARLIKPGIALSVFTTVDRDGKKRAWHVSVVRIFIPSMVVAKATPDEVAEVRNLFGMGAGDLDNRYTKDHATTHLWLEVPS